MAKFGSKAIVPIPPCRIPAPNLLFRLLQKRFIHHRFRTRAVSIRIKLALSKEESIFMRKIVLCLAALVLFSFSAFGQSQATTGNIEGRVTDQNGAVVPSIAVSVTNQDTGFGKTTVTDSNGNYIFVLLPPGSYRLETSSAQGFGAAKYENIRVTVGAKNTQDVTLTAGASAATVDVNAEGQGVETTRTSIAT